MFYFTTSVQMKHFQCVVHKPECSIQTQVVILKVLMIISSAVAEPRWRDKNHSCSSTHLSKNAVNTLFSIRFHYVHLTTCVRLEEIVDHQYPHLLPPCFKSFTAITFLSPTPFSFRHTDDLLHNNRKNAGASNHQNHRCQILQPSRSKSAIQAKLFNSSENDHVGQVNFHTNAAEKFRSRILKYPPPEPKWRTAKEGWIPPGT